MKINDKYTRLRPCLYWTLLLFLLISSVGLYGQSAVPKVEWSSSYGGTREDHGNSLIKSKDGGYIIAGVTFSHDCYFAKTYLPSGLREGVSGFLLKVDSNGKLTIDTNGNVIPNPTGGKGWIHTIYSCEITSVCETAGGGYLIAGKNGLGRGDLFGCGNKQPDSEGFCAKLDNRKNFVWKNCHLEDGMKKVVVAEQTADKGLIIGGITSKGWDYNGEAVKSPNLGLIKIADSNITEWYRTYGPGNLQSVYQTHEGGYIIAGSTLSDNTVSKGNHGKMDAWILKVNSRGDVEWQHSFGGSLNDEANSIIETKDSGFVMLGTTSSTDKDVDENQGSEDAWIVKFDREQRIIWKRCLGGSDKDKGIKVIESKNGNLILLITSKSANCNFDENHGDRLHLNAARFADACVVIMSSDGKILNKKWLGGSYEDMPNSIVEANDGGFVIAGSTASHDGSENHIGNGSLAQMNSDVWIAKVKF